MSPGRTRRRAAELERPHRRRRQRRRRAQQRKRRILLALATVLLLLFILPTVGVGGAVAVGSNCDLNALQPARIGENSFVYAADGSLLATIPAEKNRQPVELSKMSEWIPKATIAIEDRRFYTHDGVDAEGVFRALWKNISAGEVVEGGSTITQQLVRNLYISREQTVERKVKEACLAVKLDRRWSKDRILKEYINTVYYGNHAYGVEAAAQTYYARRARNLTLPQTALVVGLPQAPSVYDPFRNPEAAKHRRNLVLRAMLDSGMVTAAEYENAVATPLDLKPGRLYKRIREPYFYSYVRDELIKTYGAETVRSGGLRVHTTIDPLMQTAATRAIRETLYLKTDPAAALIAIDPATGAIKAMAANTPGKKGNQYNLIAQAKRQAGSTFKTFVLAAAIAKGMNPDSTHYVSSPFRYDPENIGDCDDDRVWCVETYSQSYAGSTSVASATLQSDNTVYAQLTLDTGPAEVAAMAKKLGVGRDLPAFPAIGLGAIEVSPLEMASAYATLAAGGIYSKPMAIKRVVFATGEADKDTGWGKPKRKRVISDGVAYEVTQVLEQNMFSGTGTGAYFGRPAAGKTGTTDNHADAWFSGYTPNLMATVWVGYPKAQIPMTNVHGIRVAGGTFPAEIWRKFMEKATANLPVRSWTLPSDWVEFTSWDKGQYAVGYYDDDDDDTYYTPPAASPAETTSGGAPATPRPATTAPPPPATTAPPPATTAPPPVTTAPPTTTGPPEPGIGSE